MGAILADVYEMCCWRDDVFACNAPMFCGKETTVKARVKMNSDDDQNQNAERSDSLISTFSRGLVSYLRLSPLLPPLPDALYFSCYLPAIKRPTTARHIPRDSKGAREVRPNPVSRLAMVCEDHTGLLLSPHGTTDEASEDLPGVRCWGICIDGSSCLLVLKLAAQRQNYRSEKRSHDEGVDGYMISDWPRLHAAGSGSSGTRARAATFLF